MIYPNKQGLCHFGDDAKRERLDNLYDSLFGGGMQKSAKICFSPKAGREAEVKNLADNDSNGQGGRLIHATPAPAGFCGLEKSQGIFLQRFYGAAD